MDELNIDRRRLLGGATALAASAAAAPVAAQTAAAQPDLSGRTVLITGTSSGFGNLAALHLARCGATVVATMRNLDGGKRPEAQALKDAAAKDKLKLHLVEMDVTNDTQVSFGVTAGERIAGGALDAVICNAGIGLGGPVEAGDIDAWRKIMDTNLYGCLRVARAALPAMRRKKQGLVMPVSSQLGRIVQPGFGLYSATKFGVEAAFETMAYELAPFGVEVTIVQPGGYPTKVWANGQRYSEEMLHRLDAERAEAYAQHIGFARAVFARTGTTDPMDVPRAFAEVIALAPGSRPLRRPVHPNTRATDAINAASAGVQAAVMASGPFAAWHKAVTS